MERYTVIGVYADNKQRYASYFWADDYRHAEEQAYNEADDGLIIAGVVRGEATLADVIE